MSATALPRLPANVVFLDEIDSTNLLAGRLLQRWQDGSDAPFPDTILVAARQRAGRGRGSNVWKSPQGGLYVTWITWLPVASLPWVPLAVSAALAEALEDLAPTLRIGLKWPNDLLVGGRKLAGILCQSKVVDGRVWVAAGFGVNVETAPALAVEPPAPPTCLREAGVAISAAKAAEVVLPSFLRRVEEALELPEAARERWAGRSVHADGDTLRVVMGEGELVGRFRGFGAHGQLLLEVGGVVRAVAAADFIAPLGSAGG